jgi:hypothetical protein
MTLCSRLPDSDYGRCYATGITTRESSYGRCTEGSDQDRRKRGSQIWTLNCGGLAAYHRLTCSPEATFKRLFVFCYA